MNPLNTKRFVITLLIFGVHIGLVACGDPDTDTPPPVDPSPVAPDAEVRLDPPPPPPPPPPICGDQVLEGDEECDDGNFVEGDGCDSACRIEQCGNGILQFGERCDQGDQNSDTQANTCRTNCKFPRCGDGVVDRGELCDDGDLDQTDACRPTCIPARCGDGILRADLGEDDPHFELCDDGEANSDSTAGACRTDCHPARCGDGVRDPGEECDLGPSNSSELGSGSSCRADCRRPRCGDGVSDDRVECDDTSITTPPPLCGNGVVDEGELCDSGDQNTDVPAAEGSFEGGALVCRSTCVPARCGDGIRDLNEMCDDGNTTTERCLYGQAECEVCDAHCQTVSGETSYCGDGTLDPNEICDDHNQENGDGCSDRCIPEGINCGNGMLDEGEDCDDGNYEDGDGCSFECKNECGNGVLDLNEVCDLGLDNQKFDCDDACTPGRFLARGGETRWVGAIPVPTRDGDTISLDEGDREALYHDEYIFQVDGPSDLRACFNAPGNTTSFPANVLKVSLERLRVLNEDEALTIDSIEGDEVASLVELDASGCISFASDVVSIAGFYRLKIALSDALDPHLQALIADEISRIQGKEIHYSAHFMLSRSLTYRMTGQVLAQGDDLYRLVLTEESHISLRVSDDGLGHCRSPSTQSRPQLRVFHNDDQALGGLALGGLYATERPRATEGGSSEEACSSLSSRLPADTYWIRVTTETESASDLYYLDTRVLPVCEGEGCPELIREPPRARLVVHESAQYVDQLSEFQRTDDEETLLSLAQRYSFEVLQQPAGAITDKHQVHASLDGCVEGPDLDLSLWSVDSSGELLRQLGTASHSEEEGACLALSSALSSGRYALVIQHTGLQRDDLAELRSTLPYKLSIDHAQPLGRGGVIQGQIGVIPSQDSPIEESAVRGIVLGRDQYTFELEEAQRVEVEVEITDACNLNYSTGELPAHFELFIQPPGAERRLSLTEVPDPVETAEEERNPLEDNGVVLLRSQFEACKASFTALLPQGENKLFIAALIDEASLSEDLSDEEAQGAYLPPYLIHFSRPSLCGNGVVEGIEECDDGNTDDDDYCTQQCVRTAICGDGIFEPELGEYCDDGNLTPFDGCSPSCDLCGNGGNPTGTEDCEPSDELDSLCDRYCTFKTNDIGLSEFTISSGAIAAGSQDKIDLPLREKAWISIQTFGCEAETPNAPRRFDTVVSLYGPTESLIETENDQESSACSHLTTYIEEGGDGYIIVESDRFNDILGYQIEVKQRVSLLIDQQGICIRDPDPESTELIPRDHCGAQSTTMTLKGSLNSALEETHRVQISSKGQSFVGWEITRLNTSTPCPSRVWISGLLDAEGTPQALDFDLEADQTSTKCATLPSQSLQIGELELVIESPSDESDKVIYTLEATLTDPVCGNGYLERGEECDLGDLNSDQAPGAGDAAGVCRTNCRLPYCGDGVVDRGEACDEGQFNSDENVEGDGPDSRCRENCEISFCGDEIQDYGEECDLGEQNGNEGACLLTCLNARCGDGVLRTDLAEGEVGFERCDDGNQISNDGCSADCSISELQCPTGHFVTDLDDCPEPELVPVCGNGIQEIRENGAGLIEGEECDDLNLISGDGCDAHCELERVYLRSGLYSEVSGSLHLYEFSVDGPSRLLVQTSGHESICEGTSNPGLPPPPALDTILNLYEVSESGALGQLVISNDDYTLGDIVSRCSRVDLTLYRAGRYAVEVASYGNEPLASYKLDVQLTQNLSYGTPLQGRLMPGETDVYEISLFDHTQRDYLVDTLNTHQDLSVSLIELSRSPVNDPDGRAAPTAPSPFPIPVQLRYQQLLADDVDDPFVSENYERAPLARTLLIVQRADGQGGLLNYSLKIDTRCGDGILDRLTDAQGENLSEECDDGNVSDGDGCSAWCRIERDLCGNGIKERGEVCDAGHLLSNLRVAPNFDAPNQPRSRSEMTASALLYFKQPLPANLSKRGLPFIIDSTAVDFEGMTASDRKRLAFSILETETDTSGVAERIRAQFPSLIEAWGRGDELSLIIKGGLSSKDVEITVPDGGAWTLSPIEALCDEMCTPRRQRLLSSQPSENGYQVIQGAVNEGDRDIYFINLTDKHQLSLYTDGCRFETIGKSAIDTVVTLYRSEQGRLTSEVARSDDEADAGRHIFCSQLLNLNLEPGEYQLYVEGYLRSPLEVYELHFSLNRQIPEFENGNLTIGPDQLLFNEFTDEFSRITHLVTKTGGGDPSITMRLLPEDGECEPIGSFDILDLITDEDAARTYCDGDNTTLSLDGENARVELSFQFTAENEVDFKRKGVVPFTYQYCSDVECQIRMCGNGSIGPVLDPNTDEPLLIPGTTNYLMEECDDGNLISDDLCTDECKVNSYYSYHQANVNPPLDLSAANWNELNGLGDDQVEIVDLTPNFFTYFNKSYNQVSISSNGFITLEEAGEPPSDHGCCYGRPIPFNAPSKALIAAYWEDLLGMGVGGGYNRWTTTADAFIVEWRNIRHYRDDVRVTVQIILNFNSHEVEIYCENCQSSGGYHTQGLRGPYPYQGIAAQSRSQAWWVASRDLITFRPTLDP